MILDAKMCTKCLEVKPVGRFSPHRTTSSGLQSWCKACNAAQNRAWKARNRDKVLAEKGRYRARHKAEIKERDLAYARANASRCAEKFARYRARKSSSPHEPYSRSEIFARWGGKCCYCDDDATALDHVTPIVKGGADAAFNLVPACTSCNSSKGAKSLAEWALTFRQKVES